MQSASHKFVRRIAWALVLLTATSVFAQTQPYAPTTGTINNLVVFVRFSDQPEFTLPLSYYDSLFNSAADSLRSFYLENSYDTLTINSTLYPSSSGSVTSYQDAHPTAYYAPYNAATNPIGYQGTESTAREAALIANALNAISAQIPPGLNLDSNSDGYVDHVAFEVYSSNLNPLPVLFYSRATYDTTGGVMLGGKHLGNYTWVSAPQDVPETYPASTEIHEMGHSFGYPDLRANSGRTPVGDWDVMSLSRPVDNGAYMKYRFTHWIADIPEITSYGTYSINDLRQSTNNSYKLKLPNSSEFLILEYRKAAGPFESNLFASGLCISRVNEAAGMWGNLGGPPFYLYYFRTNGTPSNDGTGNAWDACLSAETGRTQLTDHSNPYCFRSDGNPCGIAIYAVGSTSGSSMTFSVGDPNTVPVTHPINGYLFNGGNRVSGATVTLSGSASGVAITDSLGRYVFAVNEGGSYTITPSQANLTFTPAIKTFNNVSADQVQNFSATNNSNTISGTVTAAGIPLSGVTVTISGGNYPSPVTTDATGTYSFTVYAGYDYSVSATKPGFSLFPSSKSFANVTTNQVQNFSTQIAVTAPDAPTNVSAVGGIAKAIINFAAPVNNGGAAITGYTVTSSPGGITAIGVAAPIVVNGLNAGTSYTFTVMATNLAGASAASAASNSVTPNGAASDFNGDVSADLLWYNAATGSTVMWLMNGNSTSSAAGLLTDANWKVMATADFNGDGKADLLWYNAATGSTAMWSMNGISMSSAAGLLTDANWKVMATADFNGDGKTDLLWYNAATGSTAMWSMNGISMSSGAGLLTDANWKVTGTADFNGDGKADLLWYNAATGSTVMWLMNGSSISSATVLLTDPNWKVMAAADFNGDGKADMLWYNASTGSTAMWLMNGNSMSSGAGLLTDANWKVMAAADFNGDGKADLLWYNAATGSTAMWLMNGSSMSSGAGLLTDANWKVAATADFNGDGKADLLWYNAATGSTVMWLMNGSSMSFAAAILSDPNWKATVTPDFNGDGTSDLPWYNAAPE